MNADLVVFDEDRKVEYVEYLARNGRKLAAAAHVNIDPSTVRHHREENEGFDDACDLAMAYYAERCEEELHRRVFDGVERPIFQKGEKVGTEIQFSDRLLELALRANLPQKYKQNIGVDASIRTSGVLVVTPAPETPEEWQEKYGKKTETIEGVASPTGEPGSIPE